MFKSAFCLLPTLSARMASTVAIKPAVMRAPVNPVLIQFQKQVQPMVQPMVQSLQGANFNFDIINKIEKIEPVLENSPTEMIMTSVLRKRRLKMKKHKLRKRRKAQRALRIKIGK